MIKYYTKMLAIPKTMATNIMAIQQSSRRLVGGCDKRFLWKKS